jgi:hypothetical protein
MLLLTSIQQSTIIQKSDNECVSQRALMRKFLETEKHFKSKKLLITIGCACHAMAGVGGLTK